MYGTVHFKQHGRDEEIGSDHMDRKNHAKVKYSVSVAMPKSRKVQIRNTAMFSAIEEHIYKKNAVSM